MIWFASIFLVAFGLVSAQSSTIIYPTTAAASATVVPTSHGYQYAGCWNETIDVPGTGGTRALAGNASANNTMTVGDCLAFCSSAHAKYAGIEYGRECYCAPYLSALSEKLNDSMCLFACDGNSSQICGGSLAITLYNSTSSSHTGVAWSLVSGSATWYGFLGFVTLVLAAFL